MPLYAMAASMQKQGLSGTTIATLGGYSLSRDEDQARGKFLRMIQAERPGFTLLEMTATEVPADVLREAVMADAS